MSPQTTHTASRRFQRAFSLVEITIAVGVVACSMLVVMGLLPVGLKTMHDSSAQYGTSTIAQQIISELQLMPFTSSASNASYSISAMNGQTDYYTIEGAKTANRSDSYFTVTYSTNSPAVPGGSSTYSSGAQMVKASIAFPTQAPQQTNVLSFLIARQNSF
ncbi:hypothetical protein BH09VER1_BH09VER1_27760 [soil metagenome]